MGFTNKPKMFGSAFKSVWRSAHGNVHVTRRPTATWTGQPVTHVAETILRSWSSPATSCMKLACGASKRAVSFKVFPGITTSPTTYVTATSTEPHYSNTLPRARRNGCRVFPNCMFDIMAGKVLNLHFNNMATKRGTCTAKAEAQSHWWS